MKNLNKSIFESDYDFEEDLKNRGFEIENIKSDETITFEKEGIYVKIDFSTAYTDVNGIPDLCRIFNLNIHGENYYCGKRPKSKNDLDNIFINTYLERFI